MKTRTFTMLSMSALMLGTAMVGCSTKPMNLASLGGTAVTADAKKALRTSQQAEKALAAGKIEQAIGHAEGTVALAPQDATYRALLGRAYLAAGRFESAAQAFSDTLALDPANGRAALNLALAETALGKWSTARETLTRHKDQIAPADRGLALALAGDPEGGVAILSVAAREPAATAVTRQNFALVLALSGRWREAQAVASVDLPPAEVEKRLIEWAGFARPETASDQVAAMLGVTPVEDPGQPVALALNAVPPVAAAVEVADAPAAEPAPLVDAPVELVAPVVEPVAAAPVAVADASPAPLSSDGAAPGVSFAPRSEVVQATPARVRPATPRAVAAVSAKPVPGAGKPAMFKPAPGQFFVQLGAYDSDAVAKDAWGRLAGRVAPLKGLVPSGMPVTVGGTTYYRLSVGGFARPDADRLCAAVKRGGGKCFVRTGAGDKLASWVRSGVRAASK